MLLEQAIFYPQMGEIVTRFIKIYKMHFCIILSSKECDKFKIWCFLNCNTMGSNLNNLFFTQNLRSIIQNWYIRFFLKTFKMKYKLFKCQKAGSLAGGRIKNLVLSCK